MDGTGSSRSRGQTRSIRGCWKGCRYLFPCDGYVRSESSLVNWRPHLNLRPQVLSGTTPFPKESDEEIVGGVNIGLRPEWSPNGPIQKSVDELIEACWNQEPKERPTASSVLQTLLALGEEKPQAPMEPLKLPVDDAWDYLEDTPEFSTFGFCGGEQWV